MSKYTKEEMDKILHKEVEVILGEIDDDEVFSFKGKIISYDMDEDNTLRTFYLHTDHGAIKKFNFSYLKDIKML